jgi:hypothetical protein
VSLLCCSVLCGYLYVGGGGLLSVKLKIFVSWALPFDMTSSSDTRVEYSGKSVRDANHFRAAA